MDKDISGDFGCGSNWLHPGPPVIEKNQALRNVEVINPVRFGRKQR
jgi:hypothetical protein